MNIEQAQQIDTSPIWTLVKDEIDVWIEAEINRLRTCVPDQLHEIQARLDILEKVKKLPQVVIDREE